MGNVLWFLQAIITLKMSSYIFVNKSRAALKERVEALEVELANLKDHLTSDKEEEDTARIEQFDSEDLFFEQQKEDKLKKSIETDLKKAIESLFNIFRASSICCN